MKRTYVKPAAQTLHTAPVQILAASLPGGGRASDELPEGTENEVKDAGATPGGLWDHKW